MKKLITLSFIVTALYSQSSSASVNDVYMGYAKADKIDKYSVAFFMPEKMNKTINVAVAKMPEALTLIELKDQADQAKELLNLS